MTDSRSYRHRRWNEQQDGTRLQCRHTALTPVWVNEFPDGSIEADVVRCTNCDTILIHHLHPEQFTDLKGKSTP